MQRMYRSRSYFDSIFLNTKDTMAEETKRQYVCNATADVKQNYLNMWYQGAIIGKRMVDDGYEISLQAIGCDKDSVKVLKIEGNGVLVVIPDSEYYQSVNKKFYADPLFDADKAKAKMESGILTITFPFKTKRNVKVE